MALIECTNSCVGAQIEMRFVQVPVQEQLTRSTRLPLQSPVCICQRPGWREYLSQLIQLIIMKPYGPLEKVVVDLCAKSLRIAVKVGIFP